MQRAIIYVRVSTEEQENNHSLPSQVAGCRTYAANNGLTVMGEVEDVLSGSRLDRPGLTRVRELVNAGGVDAVIVYALDRLTRSVAHMLLLRDELKAKGVALHAVSRGVSADTPEGRLFDTIESSFAEFERLKIKERMTRGKRAKVEAGQILGQGPSATYGYQFEGTTRNKQLVILEEEATWVRQIFTWYAEEQVPTRIIAERLNAAGVPKASATRARSDKHMASRNLKGKRNELSPLWNRGNVHAILRKTVYKGEHRSRYGVVPVPAVVSEGLWNLADARLNAGRQNSKRNTKAHYLLRGRITCGCGYAMRGSHRGFYNKDLRVDKRLYTCTHKDRHPGIKSYVFASEIEPMVWQWLLDEVLCEDAVRAGVEAQRASTEDRRAALLSERASYLTQVDAATAHITKIVKLFTADILTIDEVAQQKAGIEQAKRSAETELRRVDAELASHGFLDSQVDELLTTVRHVRTAIDEGTITQDTQERIVEMLDVQVTVWFEAGEDGNAGGKRFKFLAKLTKQSVERTLCQNHMHSINTKTQPAYLILSKLIAA